MPVSIKRMKSLSKKISVISKSVLLFSILAISAGAETVKSPAPVSSDRFLMKILDRTVSVQDIGFQMRNLAALHCIYDDAFVVMYFEKSFIPELKKFLSEIPDDPKELRPFLHAREGTLKKIRTFFKMLRYSEDQKGTVSPELQKLIRESTKENKCGTAVLYKDTLKTNFIALLHLELYLRTRYGNQLKTSRSFDEVRSSVDLFVESLDKQFPHEYYW
jgi:hypothetical protein